jgi:Rrf2 family protein
MLELSKKADYALRLMVDVAANQDGPQSTADIAAREVIPYQFLRKVVQELVAAGLLTSSRGVHGGLVLAHPAQTISLLEIVRAVDEPAVSKCVIDPAACTRRSRCVIYPVWRRIQRELERAMEEVLLSDLADRHRVVCRASSGRGESQKGQAEWPIKETPNVSSLSNRNRLKLEVTPERRSR